jgi:hypothetical protein
VSEHLDWPEAEANILGDWTTSKAGADGFKSGAPKGQAGTRKKWYAVEATRDQQVRARTRFIRAVAAGFSRLGTHAASQTAQTSQGGGALRALPAAWRRPRRSLNTAALKFATGKARVRAYASARGTRSAAVSQPDVRR